MRLLLGEHVLDELELGGVHFYAKILAREDCGDHDTSVNNDPGPIDGVY